MLIAALGQYFFGITIFITSMFLIMLVLVQRGRGGGLAGALGGPGGQSAFGTKAGDLFTRITIGVAAVWIFLCAAAVVSLKAKKFTTNVTKPDAASGSMSATGDSATGDSAADSLSTDTNGDGVESPLRNAATPGLQITPPSNSGSVPPATTESGTAEVSELPADVPADAPVTETPATDAPAADVPATDAPAADAAADVPATEESGELTLDDPAGTPPSEQP